MLPRVHPFTACRSLHGLQLLTVPNKAAMAIVLAWTNICFQFSSIKKEWMIKSYSRYIINILKHCHAGFQSHCASLHCLQGERFFTSQTHQHFAWWVFLILALQIGEASHCDFNLHFFNIYTKLLFVFVTYTSSMAQLLRFSNYLQQACS